MPRTNVVGTTAPSGGGAQQCAQAGEREHITDSTTGGTATTAAEFKFHPLADTFPLMEGEEFDALVADIKANGLHEPIVIYQGMILDGRNRYRACLAAGIEPTLTPFCDDDPVAFVISANLRRRHLDESQRAMVAAKLATLKDGQRGDLVQGLPIGRASELLNVGERSVARAREVRDHGVPELVHAVEQGSVSVSAAADVATLPKCEQAEVAAGGEREILEAARTIRTKKAEQRRAERIDRPLATTKQNAPFPGGHRFNKAPRRTRLERELDAGAIHRLHVEQQRNSDLAEKLRAAETKIAGLESEVADLKAERDRLHQGLAEAHAANLALIERVKAHVSVEPPVTFGDPGPIPESLRRDRVRS